MRCFRVAVSAMLIIVAAICAAMESNRQETYFIFEDNIPIGTPVPVVVLKECPEIGYGCEYFWGGWRYQLYMTWDGITYWPVTTEL